MAVEAWAWDSSFLGLHFCIYKNEETRWSLGSGLASKFCCLNPVLFPRLSKGLSKKRNFISLYQESQDLNKNVKILSHINEQLWQLTFIQTSQNSEWVIGSREELCSAFINIVKTNVNTWLALNTRVSSEEHRNIDWACKEVMCMFAFPWPSLFIR